MNKKDSTMNNLMQNLKALRPMLPKGYIRLIAEKTGDCEATVSNALQGKTRRYDIINCAIELAMENKAILEKLERVVNE